MNAATAAGIVLQRDVVRVAGTDADSYLQGQISQDVESLPLGRSAWSLVLTPRGKINSWFRITRRTDDFLLDLDAGHGDALVTRLNRFKLRVQVTVELLSGWQMLAVRNSRVTDAGVDAAGTGVDVSTDAGLDTVNSEMRAEIDWPGLSGVDLLGRAIAMPPGLPRLSENDFEVARIRAGWPVLGSELTERTIPAEVTGLVEISVSFTKGCYTGQELVARIDSRSGNVPRPVRLIQFDDPVAVDPGAEIIADSAVVGRITSSAADRRASTAVALGPVHRRVSPPAPVLVEGRSAVVHALTLRPWVTT